MASDLSSVCTDDIEIYDEKEEGEISLEDVSSSEESHPNYRTRFQATGRCPDCTAAQQCAPWCTNARAMQKTHKKRDAAHGKENRRHIKDSSGTISKHVVVSTLQEKNDDLVPISSDSDMEIVGLPGNSKQRATRLRPETAKVRKKKKKKRSHSSVVRVEELSSLTEVKTHLIDVPLVKTARASKSRHGEPSSPRYSVRSPPIERPLARPPSRRYRARLLRSRSPLRRSRSPISRISTVERKSPRKLRSPRRSPPRSSAKSSLPSRDHAAPSPQAYVDIELLKKVRRLESVGAGSPKNKLSRSKEPSSLKEKLSNMLKNHADPSDEKPSLRTRGNTNSTNDNNNTEAAGAAAVEAIDDDEDIEVLRRLALETKQKRAENKIEQAAKVNSECNANTNTEANLDDDNDNEAYELRLIALRSAILKNHENRVKRGVKPKRRKTSKTRVDSPFGKSFLDDIPIPDDEVSRLKSPELESPKIIDNDGEANSNHPEDMDLDTDVEREKEKDSMPYSPTDDLTRQIAVGAELPSHEFRDNNDEYTFSHCRNSDKRQNAEEASNYKEGFDTPYSPSAPTKTPTMEKLSIATNDIETPCSFYGSDYEAGIDTPYSPPSPTKTPIVEKLSTSRKNSKNPYASDGSDYEPEIDTPYSPSKPIGTTQTRKISSKDNVNITETPYSPTDTPICDLDVLSPVPTENINLSNVLENQMKKDTDEVFTNSSAVRNLASSMLDLTLEEQKDVEPRSKQSDIFASRSQEDDESESPMFSSVSLLSARDDSNETIESIRTVEKLPEIDLDGSPLVPLSKELEAAEVVIPLEISLEHVEAPVEPLYLQGVPDVTRETNKIPTLVTRTLVPAPILKTNKNLQQPLPQKKSDNHTEPSFKSAEMRPVSVETAPIKSSAFFKPIKLCPILKKPQVMTTTAAAFNTSFGDDSARETKSDDDEPVVVETSEQIEIPLTETKTKSPTPRKSHKTDEDSSRKARRKRLRQRNNRKRKSSSGRAESPSSVRDRATKNESTSSNSSSKQIKLTISSSKNRSTGGSSSSPVSRLSGNDKDVPSRRSKSGQTKAPSSRSDRVNSIEKQTEASPESNSKRPAGESRRERRLSRKAEATLAEESTNSRYESQANETTKESSPGEGTSSGLTRVKSSSPTTSKSIEQSSKETNDNAKNEENSSRGKEQTERVAETEKKRRCSLDDDEQALRALLLASLPKRQKPVEVPSTPAITIVKIPRLSDTTTTDTSAENSANRVTKESTASLPDAVFTPPNPPVLSSQSSSASSATPTKTESASALPNNIDVARKILVGESSSVESSSPRKRVNIVAPKGPPKKIAKKALPVIASTKVVNNAKKYQNAMIQKKLNLQRAASICSAQNGSRNITLNNLKINEATRPSSPKITTSSKMQQRLIINLGSDTDSESELESRPSSSASGDIGAVTRKPLAIPITDFEKSLDQFLKDQRNKLESVAVAKTAASATTGTSKSAAPSTSTGKLTGLYSTPLAVRRHLPMSQQKEYRRLKHQIMERERQKLQKTIENGTMLQNRNSRSPCTPPGPLSPASPIVATQRPDNPKVSSVASQVASSALITPSVATSKDNILENNLATQQKIHLSKANDDQSTVNVTKVSSKVMQGIPNKQLTNLPKPTAWAKVYSSNPIVTNNLAKTSTPKVAAKILPKVNSVVPNVSKIPANTSTPKIPAKKAQISPNIVNTHLSSKTTSVPLAKSSIVSTTEIRRNSGTLGKPSVSTNTDVEWSTNVSSVGEKRWSLGTLSVPSASTTRTSFAPPTIGTSLNSTEMLTIQIPNDKVRMNKVASTDKSRSEGNSPTISRGSVGTLRVLTKEQLNNRFVQIQVKQGPAGRRVTVGASPASSIDFVQSSGTSAPKVLPERSDKTDKAMCCDSSLIVNENNEAGKGDTECSNEAGKSVSDDTTVANSEASTLVLSRNEGHSRNDTNFDSTASTFVAVYVDPDNRDNLEGTRTEECSELTPPKTTGAKPSKAQAKEVWDKIKTDVRNELEILTKLPIEEQEKLLIESQENLVTKRNIVLEDLTEMSGCLRQWEVDRVIQTKMIAEVRRLREQLKTAEQRLHEQRCQMNEMGPKVTKAHEKINHGRRDCYKLSRICQGLGAKVIGEDYKVPNTGAQLLNDRLKEVAVHTRQLSKKKVPPTESPNNSRDENSTSPSVDTVTISDSSLIERPSNTTISETDLNDNRGTKENSVCPGSSNATASVYGESTEAPSFVSDRLNVVETENEDSSSCDVISLTKETEDSNSGEVISLTKETEDSNSGEVISLTKETEVSNSGEAISLAKEKEGTSSLNTEKHDNEKENETTRIETITSSTPNASAKESIEYISLPGTSKSDPPTGQVSSIDQQHPAVQKVDPYRSVLTHLKMPRSDNPDGILCPYGLMGTCNDGDCQFYHLDPGHCQ